MLVLLLIRVGLLEPLGVGLGFSVSVFENNPTNIHSVMSLHGLGDQYPR